MTTKSIRTGMTLTRYLRVMEREHGIPEDLSGLILDIASGCNRISHATNRGALADVLGSAESENVQGEVQKHLDILSNDLFIDALKNSGYVTGLASEEVEGFLAADPELYGPYLVAYDPLDGSSNIDVNISVGSIFSILPAPEHGGELKMEDFLQPGNRQIAAGFTIYGPSTLMVLTLGYGTQVFTLDKDIGEYILTEERVTIPEDTNEFAINASNMRFWEPPMKRYVDDCLAGKDGPRGKNFNMRWVASMVAEVFRIMTRGGIFMYPRDRKDPSKPGRLRLMYEANPMSFIAEQAGGAGWTESQRIMDIQPEEFHQRVPVILGSKNEVAEVLNYHREG